MSQYLYAKMNLRKIEVFEQKCYCLMINLCVKKYAEHNK